MLRVGLAIETYKLLIVSIVLAIIEEFTESNLLLLRFPMDPVLASAS